MNIDSSNILSLLSSDQSLGELKQTLQSDNSVAGEFSERLKETIEHINSLGGGNSLSEKIKINIPENTEKLHKLAGLLNDQGTATDFSRLFGKGLPVSKSLGSDIDLENTLEALENVMNTLQGTNFNEEGFGEKLTTLVEKIEVIKQIVPSGSGLEEKLNKIIKEFKTINTDVLNNNRGKKSAGVVEAAVNPATVLETESDGIVETNNQLNSDNLDAILNHLDKPAELVVSELIQSETRENDVPRLDASTFVSAEKKQGIADNVSGLTLDIDSLKTENNGIKVITSTEDRAEQEDGIQQTEHYTSAAIKLAEHINKVEDVVKQIEEVVSENKSIVADLESQVELLGHEVENIKAVFYQQSSEALTGFKNGLISTFDSDGKLLEPDQNIVSVETEDAALLDDQLAAIVATFAEPVNHEKDVAGSRVSEQLAQLVKPEIKTETLSLKQMAEERSLGLFTKEQPETLLQSGTEYRKPGQDNPVINPLQYDKLKQVEGKDFNLTDDKGALKFVTDFSALNKSNVIENKAEIPPMTKHFAHPEWNKEIGERVVWMHKQAIPSAELRLNPKHLGPITIKVDVNQDQVSVAFTAQHAAVKEAIDAAMPKLREMFSAQQLNLAEVNVSQENLDQRQSRGFAQMGSEQGKGGRENNDAEKNGQKDHTKTAMEIVDEIEAGRAIASNGVLSIFA